MEPTGKSCEEHATDAPLACSVPLFDPARLPLKSWCYGSREDAVTGLVAFPDFHSHIPRALAAALAAGHLVALAIGDVDGLKDHVEKTNATDPDCYGHLAGNKVMACLGATTRTWFHQQSFTAGCAATFGGDEVIIAAAVDDAPSFHRALAALRDRLAAELPVRVSFAMTFACGEDLPEGRDGSAWKHAFTDGLLSTVDRCLFTHKAARRASSGEGGIIAVTQPPPHGLATPARDPRALLSLPTGSDTLHVHARPARIGKRDMLLLPCTGPAGLRGKRLRVTYPTGTARTVAAIALHGQAAIPHTAVHHDGIGVPLTLHSVRDRSTRGVPGDLAAALERAGLDWAVLPTHEQAQALHLITESSTPEIRTARITAVVDGLSTRPRS
ncbi:hypothetical protein [Streptomyces formicae]|uniref:GGDEF domain-containing protein n=1 Tax=Streptomyces formicae TaxID=1616117 RepID=A0ABY3WZ38_9ACTN|nr:hypothetical protein [Streptomyces formicae]UNM15756.1 GGDEF domain-containing protein [Streptomyces formicae]